MLNIYTKNNSRVPIKPPPVPDAKLGQKKPSYLRYAPVGDDLSGKQLKRELWLVGHRVLLYRLAVIALAAVGVIMWSVSLWGWGNYLARGIIQDQELYRGLRSFPDYTGIQARYAPQPLTIVSTDILTSGVNRSDAVAVLNNQNERFIAEFDYYFIVGGEPMPRQHTFLLPGETRPVAAFGLEGGNFTGSATIQLEQVRWRRVSSRDVPDPLGWQAARLNFTAEQLVIRRPPQEADAYAIQFTLANHSPYGYAAPKFYVGLMSGSALLGLIPFDMPDVSAGSSQAVDVRSFAPSLESNEVKLFPLINVYDAAVYLPPPA